MALNYGRTWLKGSDVLFTAVIVDRESGGRTARRREE